MKSLIIIFGALIMGVFSLSIVTAAGLPAWITPALIGLTALGTYKLNASTLITVCGAITMGADLECDYPLVSGTNDILYLFNFNDVESVTRDTNNKLLITAINLQLGTAHTSGSLVVGKKYKVTTFVSADDFSNQQLVSGTVNTTGSIFIALTTAPTTWTNLSVVQEVPRAYAFFGQLGSLKPKWAVVKETYTRPYDHQIDFAVFDATAAQKFNLSQMARGRFIAIIVQNYNGDTNSSAKVEMYGLDTGLIVDVMGRDLSNVGTQSAIEISLKTADNVKEPRPAATYFDTDAATTQTDLQNFVI